jgi:DNA-binding NtrC family response regulator
MERPKPSIYIVDDETALAHMTNSLLTLHGYSAVVFHQPEKAVDHLTQNPTDSVLLITDCIMGTMNGLELIEEFQKRVPNLRTILLSGTITDEFIRKCQVQPDRFIAKPYTADVLLGTIEELIRPENKTVGI